MRSRGDVGVAGRFTWVASATTVSSLSLFSCASAPSTGAPTSDAAASADAFAEGASLIGDDAGSGPCVRLQCQQVDCAREHRGTTTTVSGTVFDPAGKRPLYNVIVYVPNAPVEPLPQGVTCDACGVVASGQPVVTALTGPDGRFVLRNAPAGDAIPLVVQVGKWRKQLVIPHVEACAETRLDDPEVMHLPRNQSEGDMPQMAVSTGGCDPFECLLLKIGIDPHEFTTGTGPGRVHLYAGSGGSAARATPTPTPTPAPSATDLWASPDLRRYDVVVNACECGEIPDEKPQSSIDNLVAYANGGGRLFTTHYQYYWIDPTKISSQPAVSANPAWSSTALFMPSEDGETSITANIDTSFPKGAALAEWMRTTGATDALGQFAISEVRYNVQAAVPPAQRWVYNPYPAQTDIPTPALLNYTFNTPVGRPAEQQCGRVVYSDFHVVPELAYGPTFPQACDSAPLSPQELALEFMLFDLSACVQPDQQAPAPPPVVQ